MASEELSQTGWNFSLSEAQDSALQSETIVQCGLAILTFGIHIGVFEQLDDFGVTVFSQRRQSSRAFSIFQSEVAVLSRTIRAAVLYHVASFDAEDLIGPNEQHPAQEPSDMGEPADICGNA